jgi:hypothetical protein
MRATLSWAHEELSCLLPGPQQPSCDRALAQQSTTRPPTCPGQRAHTARAKGRRAPHQLGQAHIGDLGAPPGAQQNILQQQCSGRSACSARSARPTGRWHPGCKLWQAWAGRARRGVDSSMPGRRLPIPSLPKAILQPPPCPFPSACQHDRSGLRTHRLPPSCQPARPATQSQRNAPEHLGRPDARCCLPQQSSPDLPGGNADSIQIKDEATRVNSCACAKPGARHDPLSRKPVVGTLKTGPGFRMSLSRGTAVRMKVVHAPAPARMAPPCS